MCSLPPDLPSSPYYSWVCRISPALLSSRWYKIFGATQGKLLRYVKSSPSFKLVQNLNGYLCNNAARAGKDRGRPASLDGYIRVFGHNSGPWAGGSVASVAPKQGGCVYGRFYLMTPGEVGATAAERTQAEAHSQF